MVKVISETLLHLLYFSPIFLDNVIDYTICMINTYDMFNLDNGNVEEI